MPYFSKTDFARAAEINLSVDSMSLSARLHPASRQGVWQDIVPSLTSKCSTKLNVPIWRRPGTPKTLTLITLSKVLIAIRTRRACRRFRTGQGFVKGSLTQSNPAFDPQVPRTTDEPLVRIRQV